MYQWVHVEKALSEIEGFEENKCSKVGLMKKYIIAISVVVLILTQVSCVTYLVRSNREDNNFIQYCIEQGGQVVDGDCIDSSGKEQKNYEYFCIEQGGQYVGGGIFDWDGKCIMPKDDPSL